MSNSSHTYDTAKNLTANAFSRSHKITYNHNYNGSANTTKTATYTFKNWNTAAGGTGTTYNNSASVTNLSSTAGATVNLYAQWNSGSVTYVPIRTGYTFGGWYKEAACVNKLSEANGVYNHAPQGDITLYAKWIPITYIIKYNGNGSTGGSTANSTHTYDVEKDLTTNGYERKYTVTYNHNYSGSTNTSKTATYTFKNWNSKADGTGTAYVVSKPVTNLSSTAGATVNLYAQWNSANVSYIPKRDGYTFGGWYKESSCTNQVTPADNTTYTPTANITLYAKWIPITYTIKYNGNGSTGGSTANSTHAYDVEKDLTTNGYERKYTVTYNHNYSGSANTSKTATYTFKNWNSKADGTGKSYNNSEPVTNLSSTAGATVNLYAQWNSASVSYVPTREGYIFGGWYKELSCTNQVTPADNTTYTPTANITLYAKWTPITYTVKYNGNGSTGGSTANSTHTYDTAKNLTANGYERKYTVTYNHNYSGSTNTSKTATYTFKNWNSKADGTGNVFSNEQEVLNLSSKDKDIIDIYAQWTSSSLTYVPVREGYTFLGWYTDISCLDKVTESDGIYTPYKDIQLYAKWIANGYLVRYNGNGATGGSTVESTHKYDVEQDLTTNGYERKYTVTYNHNYDGSKDISQLSTYTFKNWNRDPEGKGESFENGVSVKNLASREGEIVDLYAQWNSESLTYIPTRTGYIFDGWYKEPECETELSKKDGKYTPTSNIIVYAKWVGNPYTIKYNGNGATKGTTADSVHVYDVEKNLTANGYEREYEVTYNHNYEGSTNKKEISTYTFKNWNREENGQGLSYEDEEKVINLSSEQNAIVNMYAQWEGEELVYVPERFGYKFDGWYKESECENRISEKDGAYTPETNIILYANWIIDEDWTKELEYTVEYYKDGNLVTEDTQIEKEIVQVLQPDTFNVRKENINIVNKYTGYKLNKIIHNNTEQEKLPDIATTGDIIKIYYEKDDFEYRVEYYFNGTRNNKETEIGMATYQDIINTYKEKEFSGYKFRKVDNFPLTITEKEENNVIKVYYETNQSQTKTVYYYVAYYKDGVLESYKKITKKVPIIYPDEALVSDYDLELEGKYEECIFEKTEPEVLPESVKNGELIGIYYVTKDTNVKIEYKDKISGEEIAESDILTGKIGEEYTTTAKQVEGYTLIEEDIPENAEGKYTKEDQIVTYYYGKNTEVQVKYLEKDTQEELEIPEIILGYEGKEYKTTAKQIEGYELETNEKGEVVYPENAEGVMTKEPQEVKYYYLQKTKVKVNHIDKVSGEILETEVKEGKVGDKYESTSKDFKGYELVEQPENAVGIMTKEEIEVNYYYKHSSIGVIEKHIDKISGQILYNEKHEGKEGDEYITTAKEFEGYEIIKNQEGNPIYPENAIGTMSKNLIEVKYYYVRKMQVIVNHVDRTTGENLIETEIIQGHEGDKYETTAKEFEGYNLVKQPENATGIMLRKGESTEIYVTYYYAKKSAGVIEKHINIKTGEVLEENKYEGNEGDEYKTEAKEFEGYEIIKDQEGNPMYPENAEGTMTEELIEVEYYYVRKAKVIVEYIDKITGETIAEYEEQELDKTLREYDEDEEIEELSEELEIGKVRKDSTEIIEGYEGDKYETLEKTFEGYKFVEVIGEPAGTMLVSMNEDGTLNDTTYVRYYYVHEAKVLVKYIDVKTEENIEEEILEGYEGEDYKTEAKEIEGYDIVEDEEGNPKYPENAEGTMKKEPQEVKYYYIRKAKVRIEYIEKETGKKIEEDKIIEGHEGDKYETEEKEIKDYIIIKEELPENAKGEMIVKENEDGTVEIETVVKYYYEKAKKEENLNGENNNNNSNNGSGNNINGGNNNNTNNSGNNDNGNKSNNNSGNNTNGGTNINSNKNTNINNKKDNNSNTVKKEDNNIKQEVTPSTGDVIPLVVISIIVLIVLMNILVQIKISKNKHKEE